MNEPALALSKVCARCGARYPSDALFCPLDGSPLQSAASAQNTARDVPEDPYLGQEISGHIEIRQLVGIGAMGRVYRAFQKGIDRDVAVKILHRELSANPQLVSRFTREAKVASRLQHPNVVQVLLAGQLPDRALYMVMEYLEGLSLQSALAAAGGSVPLPKALHLGLQLCEAAGEAHAVGIVHRDLKPENVMLVRRGTDPDFVKVLDFGIARINWGEQSVATAAGLIFGTARYISPEGAQGNAVGPPSDVYSIATLLYQMLSGRTPFEGDQAVGLLVQQIHDAPPSLRSIPRAAYVPQPLADVIMANLAKDPKKREQDARAFGHAIIDAAKQSGLSPDEISRPMLRRPGAMQLAPTERTQQHDLTAEVIERMSPSAPVVESASLPPISPSPTRNGAERPISAATAKWEPPSEFQAKLSAVVNSRDRTSNVPMAPSSRPGPVAAGSRPHYSALSTGVDETLDDSNNESPYASAPHPIATPPPIFPTPPPAAGRLPTGVAVTQDESSTPRTMPGDVEAARRTDFAQPSPVVVVAPPPIVAKAVQASEPPPPTAPSPARTPDTLVKKRTDTRIDRVEEQRSGHVANRSRSILFVVLCFVLGMTITAGWAYKTGKIGGNVADDSIYVQRATEAMYQNHFVAPPGDNVREITDDGLKKWPNDHKLLDIRVRAANELVSQAMVVRGSNDVVEALRLARSAHELDPNDPSAKRLVDQYEAELAASPTPSAAPLGKTPASASSPAPRPGGPATAPAPPASAAPTKINLEANVAQPRLGQTVEFTATVSPNKASLDGPSFTITGPGIAGGVTMAAQNPAPGVFKVSYSFLEGGKFDVVFTVSADGKPSKAGRTLFAGEAGPPKLPDPNAKPSAAPSSSGVKWL